MIKNSTSNDYIYDFSKIKDDNNKFLNLKETIDLIGEDTIYSHYLGYIPDHRKKYFSCFQEEKTPSMQFYHRGYRLIFKDFSSGYSGDCVNLVQHLFTLSIIDALKKIKDDLQISKYKNTNAHTQNKNYLKNNSQKINQKGTGELHVVLQSWCEGDLAYWKQFNIDEQLLDLYDVKAAREVYFNKEILWTYKSTNPVYRYQINGRYKIYRPFAPKKNKWFGNGNINTVFGLEQLNLSNSSICFITSSGKDVMNLKSIGYEAIALGGETYRIPVKLLYILKEKFEHVILFLNNDKAGVSWSEKMSEEFNIPYIYIPLEFKEKDPSDFCKIHGVEKEKQLIHNIIKQIC